MIPMELSSQEVLNMATLLHERIQERFGGRRLCDTSKRVLTLTERAGRRARQLGRPNWFMRAVLLLFLAAALVGAGYAVYMLHLSLEVSTITDFLQALSAALDALIVIAAGVYFILSIDLRLKRHVALKALHELRSLAQIVDMHQCDKDPDRIRRPKELDTRLSPHLGMNAFELGRYLDYCCELLSVISKIAALYAEHLRDEVSLRTVKEITDLTLGLSEKIGQKLNLLGKTWEFSPSAPFTQPVK